MNRYERLWRVQLSATGWLVEPSKQFVRVCRESDVCFLKVARDHAEAHSADGR